jgi:hypothetical protein
MLTYDLIFLSYIEDFRKLIMPVKRVSNILMSPLGSKCLKPVTTLGDFCSTYRSTQALTTIAKSNIPGLRISYALTFPLMLLPSN